LGRPATRSFRGGMFTSESNAGDGLKKLAEYLAQTRRQASASIDLLNARVSELSAELEESEAEEGEGSAREEMSAGSGAEAEGASSHRSDAVRAGLGGGSGAAGSAVLGAQGSSARCTPPRTTGTTSWPSCPSPAESPRVSRISCRSSSPSRAIRAWSPAALPPTC
jgi:hypothetical protein